MVGRCADGGPGQGVADAQGVPGQGERRSHARHHAGGLQTPVPAARALPLRGALPAAAPAPARTPRELSILVSYNTHLYYLCLVFPSPCISLQHLMQRVILQRQRFVELRACRLDCWAQNQIEQASAVSASKAGVPHDHVCWQSAADPTTHV